MLGLLLGGLTALAAPLALNPARSSPFDLELSGPLGGGRTNGFLTRAQLLALPQVTVTNAHDPALGRAAVYRGVPLTNLLAALAVPASADLLWAVCADRYASHYTREHIARHAPLLVLELDGAGPAAWPKAGSGVPMAPFYLSYADFRPAEEILGLPEGPLLPYAVTRLHFAPAAELDALLPAGLTGAAAQGARLARRDCLSCHFHHGVGGQLSGRPWALIATWAKIDPNYVRKYVRNPKGVQPESKMPGFPHYGDEAVEALVAYFKAFQP